MGKKKNESSSPEPAANEDAAGDASSLESSPSALEAGDVEPLVAPSSSFSSPSSSSVPSSSAAPSSSSSPSSPSSPSSSSSSSSKDKSSKKPRALHVPKKKKSLGAGLRSLISPRQSSKNVHDEEAPAPSSSPPASPRADDADSASPATADVPAATAPPEEELAAPSSSKSSKSHHHGKDGKKKREHGDKGDHKKSSSASSSGRRKGDGRRPTSSEASDSGSPPVQAATAQAAAGGGGDGGGGGGGGGGGDGDGSDDDHTGVGGKAGGAAAGGGQAANGLGHAKAALFGQVDQVAHEHECAVSSLSCSRVTVYRDRAEVTRHLCVEVPCAGVSSLRVSNFVAAVQANTIRVSGGTGSATILEVQYENTHEVRPPDSALINELTGKQEQLQKELAAVNAESDRVRLVGQVVTNLAQRITQVPDGSTQFPHTGIAELFTPGVLDGVVSFSERFAQRTADRDQRLASLSQKRECLQKRLQVVESRLRQANSTTTSVQRHVVVLVHVAQPQKIELDISYVVQNCSWKPSYDLRATETEEVKNVSIQYYAHIQQSSGEDWNQVRLSLSTADPNVGSEPPALAPFHVGIRVQHSYSLKSRRMASSASFSKKKNKDSRLRADFAALSANALSDDDHLDYDRIGEIEVDQAEVEQGSTAASYNLPALYSLASSNEPLKVTVGLIELEATFELHCVPSLSPFAYARACLENDSDYTLLRGPVNVFMNDNFVDLGTLSDVSPKMRFKVGLGVDHGVRVEVKPSKKHTQETGSMFSRTYTQRVTEHLVLKNTRAVDVRVKLRQTVPVSTDSKIVCHLVEPRVREGDADTKLSEKEHILKRWVILNAGGSLAVQTVYTVEWPRDQYLPGFSS